MGQHDRAAESAVTHQRVAAKADEDHGLIRRQLAQERA